MPGRRSLPTSEVVSELNPDGLLTLQPFTGYDLGELYKSVGGTPDLRFEFGIVGDDLPTDGTVVYGTFSPVTPPGLSGDFNTDGVVDAADYVMWRNGSIRQRSTTNGVRTLVIRWAAAAVPVAQTHLFLNQARSGCLLSSCSRR